LWLAGGWQLAGKLGGEIERASPVFRELDPERAEL
jgi:hypothetical protein